MKREDSLKRKKEFRYTYRTGKATQHKYFSCIVARRKTGSSCIGISVSKKQGNSVTRNRIKRRLREAVTPFIPHIKHGYNIIFVARQGIPEAEFFKLTDTVREALNQSKLLNQEEVK